MGESESESESSTWESFFSESEDEVDIVLNEQDAIISNLTEDVKNLNEYSDMLLEELTDIQKYVKKNVIKSSSILRKVIEEGNDNVKYEAVHVLKILNNLFSRVNQ
jgi:hypothetical protein